MSKKASKNKPQPKGGEPVPASSSVPGGGPGLPAAKAEPMINLPPTSKEQKKFEQIVVRIFIFSFFRDVFDAATDSIHIASQKMYETKAYKKGIKLAEEILSVYPEHGETHSMKGLCLNCLEQKDEAKECAKKGLTLARMKSHVCWHVLGLIHRSDRNYKEAIKCYKQALTIAKDNSQILKDLANLQIHTRDIRGFRDTRNILLQKQAVKSNWIGFAISHHLCGNPDMAISIIDSYVNTQEKSSTANYEDSEMYLYKNQLLVEQKKYSEALAHLDVSRQELSPSTAAACLHAQATNSNLDDDRNFYLNLLEM
jgi:tetratricopeptide (TPR) repeat protein